MAPAGWRGDFVLSQQRVGESLVTLCNEWMGGLPCAAMRCPLPCHTPCSPLSFANFTLLWMRDQRRRRLCCTRQELSHLTGTILQGELSSIRCSPPRRGRLHRGEGEADLVSAFWYCFMTASCRIPIRHAGSSPSRRICAKMQSPSSHVLGS